MPGRPRKPVEVLELTGTFRPDRHGQRRAAPGVLTGGDAWALECLCRLQARWRAGRTTAAEVNALLRLLAEFGATPASRGKVRPVASAEAQAPSPWDALAQPVQ